MVRTDDDEWEPRTEFVAYVTKAAKWAKGFIMRNGDDFVAVKRSPGGDGAKRQKVR